MNLGLFFFISQIVWDGIFFSQKIFVRWILASHFLSDLQKDTTIFYPNKICRYFFFFYTLSHSFFWAEPCPVFVWFLIREFSGETKTKNWWFWTFKTKLFNTSFVSMTAFCFSEYWTSCCSPDLEKVGSFFLWCLALKAWSCDWRLEFKERQKKGFGIGHLLFWARLSEYGLKNL